MSRLGEFGRQQALPVAQQIATGAGMATARLRMTPQFLICGAQRCGTTSMYRALREHPAVLRPTLRKGVHYFDVAYPNGMNWYRAHFPLRSGARLRERRIGHPVQTFESSPYYLFHPLAAQRIAADLPGVRVLVLVRDPVERAYSAYTHESARGYESEPFERALELEDERLAGEHERLLADPTYVSHAHQHQAYLARGHYIDQIMRMTEQIGADRVHVVDADDFFTDPLPVWAQVLEFLGLPPGAGAQFGQHNARPRTSMQPQLRERLMKLFEDSDAQLEQWWRHTPSWRR